MFERFTDRARRVVVLAQEESRLLSHDYIGTEHLLLGLLAEQEGVAARALESLNVGSEVIDTEHLLLGLIDECDGVGAQILQRLGATAQAVREAVTRLVNSELEAGVIGAPWASRPGPRAVSVARQVRLPADALAEVKDLLASIDRRLSAIERHLGIDAGREEPRAGAAEAEAEPE